VSSVTELEEDIMELMKTKPKGLTAEQLIREFLMQGVPPLTLRKALINMLKEGKLCKVPNARLSRLVFKLRTASSRT